MNAGRCLLVLAAALAPSAWSQEVDHSHMHLPGMTMPAEPAADSASTWTGEYAADRFFEPDAMAHARAMMREEMGGTTFSKFMLNVAELRPHADGDGYRWDGQAWFGGDLHRLVLRSEGEGRTKEGVETGEVQALYSRAVGRYADLQLGVRQDFAPQGRTYASLGAQGLLPFWIELEGALFVSTHGELLARAEGTTDLQLLQRLVLQPRVELNLAARDSVETRTGSGLSTAEVGLRLRYELRHEFAPYLGISWEKRFGSTADYWRAAGESAQSSRIVLGLRAWF